MTATAENLKDRDYVVVIDHSASMSETDMPAGQTRYDAAQESTEAIARELQKLDPDGITVVPFASTFRKYESTTPEKVKEIFKEVRPMGGTLLTPVLHDLFNSYLDRKKKGETKTNGEIVLIVTDGCPQDENEVAKEIVNFTKKLDRDEEYGISLLQVGKDPNASKFLKKLDNELETLGAKFDIVNTKTMQEMETVGLTEALLAALND